MRLKFRHRISLLVMLAATALIAVTIVTLVLGRQSEQQLTGIETRYLPLIELNGDLKRLFADIARTLEDAAGAGEPTKLDEADRLAEELSRRLVADAQAVIDNGGDPRALETAFRAYYAAARDVSAQLASGAEFGKLVEPIEAMRQAQRTFAPQLDAATSPNRERLAAAFATARASQDAALRIDIVVAGIALLLMALISWRIIRHTVSSLQAVSRGVERLARGEFSQPIDIPEGDELGDLAREANRTANRLREYREASDRETWVKTALAELANRIAGELAPGTLCEEAKQYLANYLGTTFAACLVDEATLEKHGSGAKRGAETAIEVRPSTKPAFEVTVPLVHEARVLGILVLGLDETPDARALELLARAGSMIGVALRVAESRQRTQALLRAAETANKELEAFSYSVSHDLRAPLRAIDGFSAALDEDEGDKLSEHGREYLGRIRGGAQRMGELIDDLLRLSRVSRGEFRRERIDLSSIANAVLTELQRVHPERTVELVVPDAITGLADARLIRITLENLLGNAWKFTSKTEHARIEFGVRTEGDERIYFVKDNGAGFDMAYAEQLFGPFQRLHADKEFPGTGIGLATVQRIIVRHGGRIWVEAAPDQGATFQFTLPPER